MFGGSLLHPLAHDGPASGTAGVTVARDLHPAGGITVTPRLKAVAGASLIVFGSHASQLLL
jgi:hypothetical protein